MWGRICTCGATNETLCKKFSSSMQKEFEMPMMGELNFFLGLQVKKMKHGTFLCQAKYCIEIIKKFGIEKCKHIEISHHFLRDRISKSDCCNEFIDSEHQLVDIFTKPLARDRFFFIRNELGILDGSSVK